MWYLFCVGGDVVHGNVVSHMVMRHDVDHGASTSVVVVVVVMVAIVGVVSVLIAMVVVVW